jgi:ligand-binding sensor domain-containing protein
MHARPSIIAALFTCAATFAPCVSLARQSSDLRFERIALDTAAGSRRVNAITQRRSGTILFATFGGLFELDSSGITPFRHSDMDTLSLSSNKTFSVREDWRGAVWVGTHGASLNRMEPGTASFGRYKPDSTATTTLRSPVILSIFEDRDGNVWFGTLGGLARATTEGEDFVQYQTGMIRSVWPVTRTPDGTIWFGTLGAGLGRLEQPSNKLEMFPPDSANPGALKSNLIVSLLTDRAGRLWVGSDGGGLYRFDPQRKRFDHYLDSATVLSIAEDKDNTLWLGTYGNGVIHFDPSRGVLARYMSNLTDSSSLPSDRVRSVFVDRDGTLWVGTHDAGAARAMKR